MVKTTILLLLISVSVFGQISNPSNIKAQPKGGRAALQIVYYRIDFTPEETEYLRTHVAELIFSVSEYGVAKLEKVNDIQMGSVIDSMMNVNDRLPEFYPETVNGRAEQGVYFLKLAWPNYMSPSPFNNPAPGQTVYPYNPYMRKLNEFSEITYRAPRYDMLVGFMGVQFDGNIRKHMTEGWGTKFDFIFYGKNGWGGGMGTTLIIGKAAQTYPNTPVRYQANNHLLTLVTGSFGKLFRETKGGQFAIQFEPAFGITSLIGNDPTHAVAMGFSPGATVTYMLPLGPGRMARQYFMPVTYRQYLSFHITGRQLMLNTEAATGIIYEFGVSYRLSTRYVANYKLKETSN